MIESTWTIEPAPGKAGCGSAHRLCRWRGGFTLVESLVAGVVLALSAGVLGLAVRQNLRALESARDDQRAAELADALLSKIDLLGPARLASEGPSEGVFLPPDERFSWRASYTLCDQADLYDVKIRLNWRRSNGSVGSVELETLLNDPTGSRAAGLKWDDL